jgi:DUF2075 family protein/DNA replication protein DnaC
MPDIKHFKFSKTDFDKIREYEFGKNWPVVYILENGREVYVGQTTSLINRVREHYKNIDRIKLDNLHVITDEEYNISAAFDIESWLIQYMSADDKFKLQNSNVGLRNHNYFDKEKYISKFELIWKRLLESNLATKDLNYIKNTDLFKFSPYKTLTYDQLAVTESIFDNIKFNIASRFVINGQPGSGKTILATYLIKYFIENPSTKHLKIALVVPMGALRKTLQNVFSKISGLKRNMVIGPSEVINDKYDILIVDEAHRLKRRFNIVNFKSYDDVNKKLNLDKDSTELDWILRSSKYQILFYDQNQSVRPSDIRHEQISSLGAIHYTLSSQLRVNAGEKYIEFIDNILALKDVEKFKFDKYDFKIFEDFSLFLSEIKDKNSKHGLSRVVAGYAWEWVSRSDPNSHDIEIDSIKLKWNSKVHDWVNSPNSINEVGSIHTIQGYDLNYVGVIIGPELDYDEVNKKLIINSDNYYDINGRRGVDDPKELERYIVNIYKTLLTRGILGTYVYVVNDRLRRYLMEKVS